MAITPNLGVTKIETGQASKEPTINEAFDRFDAALGGYLTKSVAGSSNVTLTTTEANNAIMEFTGALTGNISVALPSGATNGRARSFIAYNNTSGAFTLNVIYQSGTGVKVPQGYALRLYHNGTNAYAVGDPFIPSTNVTANAWTAVTFQNSWVNFGSSYADAQYRKIGDRVEVRGHVKTGTTGLVIFTLPAGFRPPAKLIFTADSNGSYGRFEVGTDGSFTHLTGGNTFFTVNCSFSVTT